MCVSTHLKLECEVVKNEVNSFNKDFAKQRYNIPYLRNLISIHTSRC